jgi:hypothetical protein
MTSTTSLLDIIEVSTTNEDSESIDFDRNESVSGENEKPKETSVRYGNKRKIESDDETATAYVASQTSNGSATDPEIMSGKTRVLYDLELALAALQGKTDTLMEFMLPRLQSTTAPAEMELRPFRFSKRLALAKGNAFFDITLFDIMPLSLSETMESLLKRAEADKNHYVFHTFTKEETAALKTEQKLLYVRFVKKGYLFEKSKFTPLSVKDVYKMTDDDPICLRLYTKNKEAPVSDENDVAFF